MTEHEKGFIIDGMVHYSPREASELLEAGAILVDIRNEWEILYKKFVTPNIFYLNHAEFESRYLEIPEAPKIIIADSAGMKSKPYTRFLIDKGYKNAANLIEGMVGWERDGLPIIKDVNWEMTGSCVCRLRPGRGK